MSRRIGLFALILSCCVGSANAGWDEFWERVHLDFHRNNSWPEPFYQIDREAVRGPFNVMKDVGWRHETTMVGYFFDATSNELTVAGQRKIDWIVRHAPLHRRSVFVLRGESQEVTSARVDAVQREISRILPEGELPPVMVTDRGPQGSPGQYFDTIGRQYIESIPSPRLPSSSGGGSE